MAGRAVSQLARSAMALALLVCLVAADLAGIAHDLSVRHAVCLEHGELVDVPLQARRPSPTGPALEETARRSMHHHCAAGMLARAAERAELVALPPPVLAQWTVCSAPDLAAGHRAIGLLRLAPKSSPPRPPRG